MLSLRLVVVLSLPHKSEGAPAAMNHDHGGLQDYARVAPDSRVAVELLSKVIPMRNSSTLAAPVALGNATHIWS
jgi:hypothetical protein